MSDVFTPLKTHAEGKRTYDEARAKHPGFGEWEDLSEASRQQWIAMMVTAIMRAEVWR